jgi:hypothetical protein
MPTLLEQFALVKDFASLKAYVFNSDGTIRPEVIPEQTTAESAKFDERVQALIKTTATGTGATTAPVTSPVPPVVVKPPEVVVPPAVVVPPPVVTTPPPVAVSLNLLPTKMKAGFELTGTNRLEYPLDLVQGQKFRCELDVADFGWGFYVEFTDPQNKKGFSSRRVPGSGKQVLELVAEQTGMFLFTIMANGNPIKVTAASLIKLA